MPDPAPFDHSRAAAFEERLVGVLNAGALCLMTSLGHRVGLFDAMADMPAAGSEATIPCFNLRGSHRRFLPQITSQARYSLRTIRIMTAWSATAR